MSDEKLTYDKLDQESEQSVNGILTSRYRTEFIRCKGFLLPKYFQKFGDRIKEMDVRDDDVWVCSFPKTGTTWTQEMVWCLGNNLDFEAAKEFLPSRFPFLDLSSLFDHDRMILEDESLFLPPSVLDAVTYINQLPSPRFIKTHLPYNLLPEKLQKNLTSAKIVYVARNPRDTCVSYYHHSKLLEGYKGSFEQFAELFLKGIVNFGPFFEHVKGYWQQRNNPNVLFLKYEEMKKDLESVIYKTAKFIGKTINEDDVQKLLDHLSFSNMKNNTAVNYEIVVELSKKLHLNDEDGTFMRQGKIGEWKGKMNPDLCEQFKKWEEKNLQEIEFSFSS